ELTDLFGRYGPVHLYPREAGVCKFEWYLDADLDESFNFLLHRLPNELLPIINEKELFMAFLAGFFDAEGSVYLHRKIFYEDRDPSIFSQFGTEDMYVSENHDRLFPNFCWPCVKIERITGYLELRCPI